MNKEMATFNEVSSDSILKRVGSVNSRKIYKIGTKLEKTSQSMNESIIARQQERGVRKCSSESDMQVRVGEVIGDGQLNKYQIREKLMQATKELNLSTELIENKIRTYAQNVSLRKNLIAYRRNSSVQSFNFAKLQNEQLSSDINPAYLRKNMLKQGLTLSQDPSCLDMTQIINDINRFTDNMDTETHKMDWQNFRSNLQKIHTYYSSDVNYERDSMNVIGPINTLIKRTKTHCKLNSFNAKVEEFYRRYNQTLCNRQKAYKDMRALQFMRKKIACKLSHFETDIHDSRYQLLRRGVQNK